MGSTIPDPMDVWRRLRARRGRALLLLPAAVIAAVMTGGAQGLAAAELTGAAVLILCAPRLAAKVTPYALLGLGLFGLHLADLYASGFVSQVQYGLVLAGAGSWRTHLVLVQAAVFLVAGLWLLVRVRGPGAGPVLALLYRWRDPARGGIGPTMSLLLFPVLMMTLLLLGPRDWFGAQWVTAAGVIGLDALAAAACLVLVFRSRVWAATLAEAGLLVLGGYGLLTSLLYPGVPGFMYGIISLGDPGRAVVGAAAEGLLLVTLGLWLAPRVMREHLARSGDPELAARTRQLTQRVDTLTRTRSDAVDTAATELRRIERDLHDGAQARLVALGMSLQAAERLFPVNPDAALALVSEAKESSSRALTELRDLVRGIYPPVLADRGLADAIRALALDTPLPVDLDVALPSTPELPVASAVYFSVAEALTNVAKHAAARKARIQLTHQRGMLQATISDDGVGGADPAHGTGLAGVERRLATFDGILAVSSPPGGPTIIAIEVPCALSSPKTSSC